MEIGFQGKYKSITDFNWINIPDFVVITGPNGTGKTQLLELIYKLLIGKRDFVQKSFTIGGLSIAPSEVTFLRGEWQLQNTGTINLSSLQQVIHSHYSNFSNYHNGYVVDENNVRLHQAFQDVLKKAGKVNTRDVSQEEFSKYFPEILMQRDTEMSQKIAEIFLNYRLSEIEQKAEGKSEEEVILAIGEKPWTVLREILREAKLPFEINDPSGLRFRDSFHLRLTHTILKEEITFNDLSSGEKVLMSLVFYLYNSQEKKIFPKLLLLDEPDAHLHPSMSQQFLNVVKNVLVDKFGVKVVMTTHSPSTVMLAPEECIYEMSRTEPRIRKSPSKNHAVSLLTAGLVYVGEGTKYFLVEDNDDVTFYSYVYNQLATASLIDTNIPLVFIPASTKDKSGGKDMVQNWVTKLQGSGLVNILHGLIDADSGNATSDGVYKIDRYSIENYLADPLLVYAALIDKEKHPALTGIKLTVGEEYKLKSLPAVDLQKVADSIIDAVEPELKSYFHDFDEKIETQRVEITFTDDIKMFYPKWLLHRRGKTIINEVYNKVFTSPVINFSTLLKALRKLNIFPQDLVNKLANLKNAGQN